MATTDLPSRSAIYWREREQAWIAAQPKTEDVIQKELAKRYKAAHETIAQRIAAEFGRYAGPRGYTMEQAQQLVDMMDVRAFAEKARRYVQTRDFTDEANAALKLYNLKMRTSRLQLLKHEIALELIALGSDEQQYIGSRLTAEAVKYYGEQSGILGLTINDTARRVEAVVNASFQTASWSDRIWANQEALRGEVDKFLTRGVLNGEHPRKIGETLQKSMGTSEYDSLRLARTEMSRVRNQINQELYTEAGYKHYEYIAEPTACKICARLDYERIPLADAVIGINQPPMHPNCKCSTAPHADLDF